jgi:small subunit ribosomal protein S13
MSDNFNYLVRIHDTNIDGTKTVATSLCEIRGVGIRLAQVVVNKLDIDPEKRLGALSDAEVKKISAALENPSNIGIPKWMFNRRKDPQTGEDIHLLTSDLIMQQKNDIDLMKETRSWKGERHSRGLKVRGQRTKTTARKGRSVGVSRRRVTREQRVT